MKFTRNTEKNKQKTKTKNKNIQSGRDHMKKTTNQTIRITCKYSIFNIHREQVNFENKPKIGHLLFMFQTKKEKSKEKKRKRKKEKQKGKEEKEEQEKIERSGCSLLGAAHLETKQMIEEKKYEKKKESD